MNHANLSAGILVLLTFSSLALAAGVPPPPDELEQGLAPDERERMHRELDQFSSNYYPGYIQIEERRKHLLRERFKQADQDNDGTLTREEADLRMPSLSKHFDEMDTDNDGVVNVDEVLAAQAKMREQREIREFQARQESDRATAIPLRGKPVPPKKRAKPATPPSDNDSNQGS